MEILAYKIVNSKIFNRKNKFAKKIDNNWTNNQYGNSECILH